MPDDEILRRLLALNLEQMRAMCKASQFSAAARARCYSVNVERIFSGWTSPSPSSPKVRGCHAQWAFSGCLQTLQVQARKAAGVTIWMLWKGCKTSKS